MRTATMADNPFALMMDPARVRQMIDESEALGRLSQRQCHPLDRAVIRSASAELAAYDAKIDRTTVYLPPEEETNKPVTRPYGKSMNQKKQSLGRQTPARSGRFAFGQCGYS